MTATDVRAHPEGGQSLLVVGASEVFDVPEATAVRIEDGLITGFDERGWNGPVLDVEGRAVVPGFVDAHTHLLFAGERREEFAARVAGHPYEAGGIQTTVRATRAASDDDLVRTASARARRMLADGTTTVEVKTGYVLETEGELHHLELAGRITGPRVEPTFLAHLPPYDPLPALPRLPEGTPVDVFCDEGAYSVEQTRAILTEARRLGLPTRLHANELGHTGGIALAAEFGCRSADHVLFATETDARLMADAEVVAALLPATSFCLGVEYAPAQRFLDAGVQIALGTDCNPGTSYVTSMPFVLGLGVSGYRLHPTVAVRAATAGSARALGLPDRGELRPGMLGDLAILDSESHLDVGYRPPLGVWATVLGGEVVAGHEATARSTAGFAGPGG
ncbi:MAG: imidazolonepropionase [Egibacteraceae bacterium]